MYDWIQERFKVEKLINGALKDAINSHGPITKTNFASASKRVYGVLKEHRKQFLSEEMPYLKEQDKLALAKLSLDKDKDQGHYGASQTLAGLSENEKQVYLKEAEQILKLPKSEWPDFILERCCSHCNSHWHSDDNCDAYHRI